LPLRSWSVVFPSPHLSPLLAPSPFLFFLSIQSLLDHENGDAKPSVLLPWSILPLRDDVASRSGPSSDLPDNGEAARILPATRAGGERRPVSSKVLHPVRVTSFYQSWGTLLTAFRSILSVERPSLSVDRYRDRWSLAPRAPEQHCRIGSRYH
jgi:hypothetical protein